MQCDLVKCNCIQQKEIKSKLYSCIAIKIHPWKSGQSLISARKVLFSFLEYISVWGKLVALDILLYNIAIDASSSSHRLLFKESFYTCWHTRFLPAPCSYVLWCFLSWQPIAWNCFSELLWTVLDKIRFRGCQIQPECSGPQRAQALLVCLAKYSELHSTTLSLLSPLVEQRQG